MSAATPVKHSRSGKLGGFALGDSTIKPHKELYECHAVFDHSTAEACELYGVLHRFGFRRRQGGVFRAVTCRQCFEYLVVGFAEIDADGLPSDAVKEIEKYAVIGNLYSVMGKISLGSVI